MPVCYVKDNEANTKEAKQLMIKLTRVASRQDTPKTDTSLNDLLQDMLTLQSLVFTCINQDTCYEIFAESLLCSNDVAMIILAGDLLTVTPSALLTSTSSTVPAQTGSKRPSFNFRLSYDTSLKLVVSAAKEYFNSAQSFMHDDMNLARKCLDLFPTPPPLELCSELNLIASLALLDDFGVKMLPVQVRLCENKLDLIRNCLDSSPLAYKDYHTILRLSKLLGLDTGTKDSCSEEGRIDGAHLLQTLWISEGRGHTLIVIALTALQNQDFSLVHQLCSELMYACFSPAWEVCRSLALDSGFSNLPAKLILLNFSVTHCPPENIVDILSDRQTLELQLLCAKHCAITKQQRKPVGPAGHTALTTAVGHGVQQVVRKGADALQQMMSKRASTEQATATSQLTPITKCLAHLQSSSDMYSMEERVKISLSCHPFCLNKESKQVPRDSNYVRFNPEPNEQAQTTWQALLRAKLLANECNEQKEDCTEVLLKLSERCSEMDTHLMLGYLLALTKVEEIELFFSKVVPSKFSLEFAIYYICLQLYATTLSLDKPMISPHLYLHQPLQLVEYVTSLNQIDCSENYVYVTLLRKYQELLDDYTQGEVLLGLGLGIDIEQFTSDTGYKKDIILTLARSLNPQVCSISLSLSHRHGIPEWEVYMAIMDSLLTSFKLSGSVLHQKIKELGVVDPLLKHSQQTADYLRNYTYLNMPGNKYVHLIQYFTLLGLCCEHGATVKDDIGIATHLRLLKKFKSALPTMDYKQLMSGHEDPLLVLVPFLTSANVHVVSKVAKHIPCHVQGEGTLTSGMVFSAFALKLFWKGEGKGHEAHSTADWLHRFESCHDYLLQLSAKELRHFLLEITLSQRSLMFELETRIELTKRALKFTQQILKKNTATEKAPHDPFEELKYEFEGVLVHLQNLSTLELGSQEGGISQELWKNFFTNFDLSGSDPDKVHSLALEMVTCGVSFDSVQLMLTLAHCVNHHKDSIVDIVKESLICCLKQLEQPLEPNTLSVRDYSALEKILLSVSHQESKNNGTLVSTADIMMVLKPFCSDSTKPAIVRRAVLLLTEKYLVLPEQDHHLLLLYQTQSVVLQQFGMEASLEDISSKNAQQQLFTSLLAKSDSVGKLLSLVTLLDGWEQQESTSTYVQCWIDLLLAVVRYPDAISHVVTIRAGLKDMPSEIDEKIYSDLLDENYVLEAMKFSLTSLREDMIKNAIEKVNALSSAVDVNLLELILVRRKAGAVGVVNGPLLHLLCDYVKHPSMSQTLDRKFFSRLLCCSEANVQEKLRLDSPTERLKEVIDQLSLSGFKLEANSILLDSHSLHPAVATLNNAFAFND